MPKYDYRCTACGNVYEKRESFSAPSLQECPSCHGQARRVLTPPAIVFKGSGWYKTDSRGSEPVSSRSSGSSTAAVSTDTPRDTTTEAKTESKSTSTEAAAAD